MMGSVTVQLSRVKIGFHPNIGCFLHFRRDQSVPYTLYFWNQPAGFSLPHPHVAEELQHGNDVEGLIDLPVKRSHRPAESGVSQRGGKGRRADGQDWRWLVRRHLVLAP
jgi:hypothetical protein